MPIKYLKNKFYSILYTKNEEEEKGYRGRRRSGGPPGGPQRGVGV